MVFEKSEMRKSYKGVTLDQNMKKSGVSCFSCISLNQLGLKKCNLNNLCSNFKVTTNS